jgi:hypothetical protein
MNWLRAMWQPFRSKQPDCNHVFWPEYGTIGTPTGQRCTICDKFVSLDQAKILWEAAQRGENL